MSIDFRHRPKKIVIFKLCTYLPRTLNSATTSLLVNGSILVGLSEKRIFKAVPMPWTCNFPHNLHLLQPTQSIIRVIFLKWSLNAFCRKRNKLHVRHSISLHHSACTDCRIFCSGRGDSMQELRVCKWTLCTGLLTGAVHPEQWDIWMEKLINTRP